MPIFRGFIKNVPLAMDSRRKIYSWLRNFWQKYTLGYGIWAQKVTLLEWHTASTKTLIPMSPVVFIARSEWPYFLCIHGCLWCIHDSLAAAICVWIPSVSVWHFDNTRVPLYYHDLNEIRTWICNHINCFLWNEITHPCFNFNSSLAKLLLKLGHG